MPRVIREGSLERSIDDRTDPDEIEWGFFWEPDNRFTSKALDRKMKAITRNYELHQDPDGSRIKHHVSPASNRPWDGDTAIQVLAMLRNNPIRAWL